MSQHPELYREAFQRAQRMGMYEKRRRKLLPVMITPDCSQSS
jgi:hypothetical protein